MPLYRINEEPSKRKTLELLVENVIIASSFAKRFFGLILETRLDTNTCFFIDHCNSIHTVGMQYSLDVIFLKGVTVAEALCFSGCPSLWHISG